MTPANVVTERTTLSRRLLRINRITLGASISIMMVIVVASSFALGLGGLLESSRLQARVLAEGAAAPMMFNDARAAEQLLQPLRNLPQVRSAALYTVQQAVLASYQHDAHGPMDGAPISTAPGQTIGPVRLEVFEPIVFEGQSHGSVHLSVNLTPLYWQTLWQLLAECLNLESAGGAESNHPTGFDGCRLWLARAVQQHLGARLAGAGL
jgi:Periplasmic sensor domain